MSHSENSQKTVLKLMEILSKKWILLLFHEFIMHKEIRFNELKNNIPDISSKMLSQRLLELEKLGFIERKIMKEKPVLVLYIAKEKIKDILPLFEILLNWSKKWNLK